MMIGILFVTAQAWAGASIENSGLSSAAISAVPGKSTDLTWSAWHVSQGDDPKWKDPSFDDSPWRIMTPADTHIDRFLCRDVCWYRLRVAVPNNAHNLSLGLDNVDSSYEVFINGQRIGGHGGMPPHPSSYASNMTLYPVPDAQLATGELVIVVRLWVTRLLDPSDLPGGISPNSQMMLGETSELDLVRRTDVANTIYRLIPDILSIVLSTLIGCAALYLYFSQRNRREYLCAFGLAFFNMLSTMAQLTAAFDLISTNIAHIAYSVSYCAIFCYIEIVFAFLNRRVPRYVRFLELAYALLLVPFFMANSSLLSQDLSLGINLVMDFPSLVLPILLLHGLFRGNLEVRFLAIATSIEGLYRLIGNLLLIPAIAPLWPSFSWIGGWQAGPVLIPTGSVLYVFSWLATGQILLSRSNRMAREGARAANELQAAKAVQDVLIPENIPVIPGFVLTSAYKPAQEVGGDFFQIVSLKDGSTLVVVGDVSGKGLKASMMVSLIVGVIRTATETTSSPAELLAALNRHLHGRMQGGFATCIAIRLSTDSDCQVASAGHVSPFLDGNEISLPGAFPLGMISDNEYEQICVDFPLDAQLNVYTDGLLEARKATGELYGFERLKTLFGTKPTASQAMEEAIGFGQDDDVTVLTVIRESVPPTHVKAHQLSVQMSAKK